MHGDLEEVNGPDGDEAFEENLKASRVRGAHRTALGRRRASERADRPLRFASLAAIDEQIKEKIC